MGRLPSDETTQCASIAYDSTRCNRKTTDSSGLCGIHRKYFRALLEVEIMKCHDCPLPVYDAESGELKEEQTYSNCSRYMSNAQALCFFELGDVFNVLDGEDSIRREYEWIIQKLKMMSKRAMMFQAKSATISPDAMRLLDQYRTTLENYSKLNGYFGMGKGPRIPVEGSGQMQEIINMLMNESDGTMDADSAGNRAAAGVITDREKRVILTDYSKDKSMDEHKPKTDVLKELVDDGEDDG